MSDRSSPQLSTDTGYRRSGGGRRPEGKRSGGAGKQIGMNLVVAILLGGLVLAGWFIANQQQMLAEEQARVNDANQRLERLEARLSATDSAMSQGGQDTKQQINLWESEIRKLWAISNERNKKWIQDNQKAVKNITNSINGRIYDFVDGYLDFETLEDFVTNDGDLYPSDGTLKITGANGASITLEVVDNTGFMVYVDVDGDGVSDWQTSSPQPWDTGL